ncbi:hypothetical protein HMPREF0072_1644 [Anaerococcus lactolyticus ATCC 51172]|uniref:Uncharacterized protein n=1 Tax=Anaerococcus lactolyticus ATCC 51172 TaxID=525254 RepID=C2BH24_9FIRM|nr:hypothetical protein HMPREF0072_1644 [Anaerococcus lactolyticus ATCC 51172]
MSKTDLHILLHHFKFQFNISSVKNLKKQYYIIYKYKSIEGISYEFFE